jgi:hypothetical protein
VGSESFVRHFIGANINLHNTIKQTNKQANSVPVKAQQLAPHHYHALNIAICICSYLRGIAPELLVVPSTVRPEPTNAIHIMETMFSSIRHKGRIRRR